MPVSRKATRKPSKKSTRKSGKKKSSSSFLYNPMDPFNQYPNHETGEEEYGPIPPFGYNKEDPMNMKPFNPNVMNAMFGTGPMIHPPQYNGITYGAGTGSLLMPPPFNMLGLSAGYPNPAAPLLQPMTPEVSTLPTLPAPGTSSLFPFASSVPTVPSYGLPNYGMQTISPQNYHPQDPNNQFPNPNTGSMTNPGPALEGGINPYDPYNVIGAPQGTPSQNAAMYQKMKNQPRDARSPYILH